MVWTPHISPAVHPSKPEQGLSTYIVCDSNENKASELSDQSQPIKPVENEISIHGDFNVQDKSFALRKLHDRPPQNDGSRWTRRHLFNGSRQRLFPRLHTVGTDLYRDQDFDLFWVYILMSNIICWYTYIY